jgi:hypothetical protein
MPLIADNVYDFDLLKTVNECQVSQLKIADPSDCMDFYRRIRNVEAAVVHTYQLTAFASIREKDPQKASGLWKEMLDFCDSTLNVLRDLKVKYPNCGASNVYNTTLDYRGQIQKRYIQNLQDSECQTMPEGLFPIVN